MNFILIYAILGTFPKAFSQVASSQVYFRVYSFSARLSACSSRGARPPCSFWPLRKFQIWEMANWEIAIREVALVKMPLEKYLTPIDR